MRCPRRGAGRGTSRSPDRAISTSSGAWSGTWRRRRRWSRASDLSFSGSPPRRAGLAQEGGVAVVDVFADAVFERHARGILTGWEARNEEGARAELIHFILHELVQAVDDGRDGDDGGDSDDDAENREGGTDLVRSDGAGCGEDVLMEFETGHGKV